jgi:hypothetical protein
MDDLLASIRKAINEDPPARPAIPRGDITGSMRELRGRLDEATKPARDRPQSEILDLRNRIAGQMAERTQLPASRPGGFAGILSGEGGRPARSLPAMVQEPGLRRGYATADPEPAEPEPSMDEFRDEGDATVPDASRRRHEVRDHHREFDTAPYRRGMARSQGMLSPEAEASAEAAFGRLAETLMSRALGERSIEEITRELLRTMLKQWLDDHLPALVERLVREEIERVARRGGR